MERSGSFSGTNVAYQQLDNDNDNSNDHEQSTQNAHQNTIPSHSSSPDASSTSSQSTPKITVSFRTLSGQVMRVELPTYLDAAGTYSVQDMTVYGLKQELERCHQIPVNFQRLIFGGRELTDDMTLRSMNIEDQSMIHLLLKQAQTGAAPTSHPAPHSNFAFPGFGNDHQAVEIADQLAGATYSEDVDLIYQLGRSIKVLSLIDTLWLILISLRMSYYFNFGLILACIGILGAHQYRRDFTAALLGFILLAAASRVLWMMENGTVLIYVILSFAILVDLYLFRLVVVFIKKLRNITPEDRAVLLSRNRTTMNAF